MTAGAVSGWAALPTDALMLSASHPKGVHRDIHNLCVLIVTAVTVTWSLIPAVPAGGRLLMAAPAA